MALFDWIIGKKPNRATPHTESSGLTRIDATRPVKSAKESGKSATPAQHAANRKSERMVQRELLYVVVREAMMRVGVLSSSYKFKVLSLDARGRQFMVMMDVSVEFGNDAVRLSEIEVLIAQGAKARYDIVVTAVYWRINDYVAVGASQKANLAVLNKLAGTSATSPHQPRNTRPMPLEPVKQHDPIDDAEMAAFKRALEGGKSAPKSVAVADHSAKSYGLLNGYEDTELPGQQDDPQALSGTQYGSLN